MHKKRGSVGHREVKRFFDVVVVQTSPLNCVPLRMHCRCACAAVRSLTRRHGVTCCVLTASCLCVLCCVRLCHARAAQLGEVYA